ncbi:MAG: pro-sigmaK processing inhibitor BofA family protein [Candidatus Micrarchaeia archaeon]
MAIFVEVGVLIFAVAVLYLIYHFLKNPLLIIGNSILGLVVFAALNMIFHLGIPINFWSISAVALGGFVGLIFVLVMHFLGLGF